MAANPEALPRCSRSLTGLPSCTEQIVLRLPPATDQQLARILMGSPMDIPMQLPLPSTRTAGRAKLEDFQMFLNQP
jgi:hypothetical protein